MVLTKEMIDEMANEVYEELRKREIIDTIMYFNNKKRYVSYGFEKDEDIEGVNPHDYFDCAYEHILSMSFEGGLYEEINYGDPEWLMNIFDKYGCYYEQWDAWNLSVYPSRDDMEIEYTYYERPKEKIYIFSHNLDTVPLELAIIKREWDKRSEETRDLGGSCTIGDGFEFTFNGEDYKMSTPPIQGSLSYEKHVPDIRKMLETIEATNIYYNYGMLD